MMFEVANCGDVGPCAAFSFHTTISSWGGLIALSWRPFAPVLQPLICLYGRSGSGMNLHMGGEVQAP
jgi:hypothetical protein